MKLISNKITEHHLSEISKQLDSADEIIFCVAFLKNSGLNSIIEKLKDKTSKSQFYIGTDFYLTEPSALRRLFNDGHKVYIIKKERSTYHPKIFYFKKDNTINILIGSTNLTSGGLETNIESSVALQTSVDSSIDKDFKNLIESLNQYSTQIINDQTILDYEKRYLAYKARHKKADIDFEIDLLKIIEEENQREIELEKLNKNGTTNSDSKQTIVKIRPEDYQAFPVFLPKYIDYTTNIRKAGAVNKNHSDKELVKWYDRMKELIRNEALPDDLALQLIDADFPFDNAWESTIKMMWNKKFKDLLEFKEKEQKHLTYTYVPQTKNRESPYYKLGTWIAMQKQRRKEQHGSTWGDYEEQKMQSINYLWDSPELGGELDDEGWWSKLLELQKYYSEKKNYHSVPSQKTKLGRWLNEQMTLKNTGTRQLKEKKYLNKLREELLEELLKKNNVEWKWQEQLEREAILEGLKGWRELTEWETKYGNRKPTSAEVNYFKPIRDWKAGIRNRSKKWDRNKEKWKIDLLTKAGFPLPEPNDFQNEESAST